MNFNCGDGVVIDWGGWWFYTGDGGEGVDGEGAREMSEGKRSGVDSGSEVKRGDNRREVRR